jgi:hypothetical protein
MTAATMSTPTAVTPASRLSGSSKSQSKYPDGKEDRCALSHGSASLLRLANRSLI